ncbi:hypothetical protein CVT24_013093 [Panaeolus cyanescens]|uniref:G domain-containing protein n=1 Tax=Panaeolus cyanescens TaxID=181874 RepID=A0A409WR28_9AGAR|nr:hypothetical protein CVT24_013093 [Panaeolus cyanescens]
MITRYGELTVEGLVNIVPCTPGLPMRLDAFFVVVNAYLRSNSLLGPSRSGKSAFIESFCPNQNLAISTDVVASATQVITPYSIGSVFLNKRPLVLIDTPGLVGDRAVDWARVILPVYDFMRSLPPVPLHRLSIFYFDRITDNQVSDSGSRYNILQLFKTLVGTTTGPRNVSLRPAASEVTIVTTMWNTAQDEHQSVNRYQHLRKHDYKDLVKQGANMVQFDGSTRSAFEAFRRSADISSAFPEPHAWFNPEILRTLDPNPHRASGSIQRALVSPQRPPRGTLVQAPPYVRFLHEHESQKVAALKSHLGSIDLSLQAVSPGDARTSQFLKYRKHIEALLKISMGEIAKLESVHPTLTISPQGFGIEISSEAESWGLHNTPIRGLPIGEKPEDPVIGNANESRLIQQSAAPISGETKKSGVQERRLVSNVFKALKFHK